MNLIQFFNTENSSSSGLRATKPVVYQEYLTIATGTGASFQSLMPALDITDCAAYGGQIVNNGCYDLKVTAYYLKGDDCDTCTVDTLTISIVEFFVPKNSVFPMPDGFYQKVDVQTVDSTMTPFSNTTEVKVSMHTSHVPNCTGCVNPVVIDETCYTLYASTTDQLVNGWSNGFNLIPPFATPVTGSQISFTHWEEEGTGTRTALTTPIPLFDSFPTLNNLATIQAASQGELLTLVQQHVPFVDSVKVEWDPVGLALYWYFYDSTNLTRDYTGTCVTDICISHFVYSENGVQKDAWIGSSFSKTLSLPSGGSDSFKTVTVNGVTTYYENGVVVTDTVRIAEIDDLIANDPNMTEVAC